jgi:colicin import membrane protein
MSPRHVLVFALAAAASARVHAADLNVITGVEVKDQGGTVVLEVRGSKAPNFTTFSMADPPRFVIDLSEAKFQGVPEDMPVNDGTILVVKNLSYGSDATSIARVMVAFSVDVEPPDVQAAGNTLVVKVAKPAGAAVAQASDRKARDAEAQAKVEAEKRAQAEAEARAEAEKKEAQAQAAALAAALPPAAAAGGEADKKAQDETDAKAREQAEAQARADAEKRAQEEAEARAAAEKKAEAEAQAAAAADKAREEEAARKAQEEKQRQDALAATPSEQDQKKLDAQQRREAEKAEKEQARLAKEEEKRRKVEEARAAKEAEKQRREEERLAKLAALEEAKRAKESEDRLAASAPSAQLQEVGFRQMPGVSRVFVRTSVPAQFTIQDVGNDTVRVELQNTRVRRRNDTRFLDTSFFPSAVAMISPSKRGSSYVVDIKLKQKVPYQQKIEGDMLAIDFERPGAAAAPPAPGAEPAAPATPAGIEAPADEKVPDAPVQAPVEQQPGR